MADSWDWGGTSEAQRRASEKYDKAHTTQVKMKLNLRTDMDIINQLRKQPNVQGYIKSLIRADIGGKKI